MQAVGAGARLPPLGYHAVHHVAEGGEVLVVTETVVLLDGPACFGDGEALLHAIADQVVVFLNRHADPLGVSCRAGSSIIIRHAVELARQQFDCLSVARNLTRKHGDLPDKTGDLGVVHVRPSLGC